MREMNEDENTQSKLKKWSAPFFLKWFLSGDKYLHENSLPDNVFDSIIRKGALLYAFVFALNEFIFHFVSYTGILVLRYLLGYPMIITVVGLALTPIARRILFGVHTQRPNPAIGLPDRMATRHDYQNVIPPYGGKGWLIKRLAAYVVLQCSVNAAVLCGWAIMLAISIPYFLLQK
jgi:hypothetical protein